MNYTDKERKAYIEGNTELADAYHKLSLLDDLCNNKDMDDALMEHDTINGTALLSQWETLQGLI